MLRCLVMSALRFSAPGCVTIIINEPDPFAGLTRRQGDVLAAVRGCNGNRSRAARTLGISVQSVQASVRLARRAGAPIPRIARRGPDRGSRGRAL